MQPGDPRLSALPRPVRGGVAASRPASSRRASSPRSPRRRCSARLCARRRAQRIEASGKGRRLDQHALRARSPTTRPARPDRRAREPAVARCARALVPADRERGAQLRPVRHTGAATTGASCARRRPRSGRRRPAGRPHTARRSARSRPGLPAGHGRCTGRCTTLPPGRRAPARSCRRCLPRLRATASPRSRCGGRRLPRPHDPALLGPVVGGQAFHVARDRFALLDGTASHLVFGTLDGVFVGVLAPVGKPLTYSHGDQLRPPCRLAIVRLG